ncbi:class I SAM-dependent methyltransferase [Flavobacterium urumqiense]|uniref:SAM-dependent methyltransferase, MidA family n=1 Tax=Flavobacterium urumqiense TaxID=935224 RepID=A0A1H5W0F5_9FLAO|nr:SAM-dependent methyltransferase [Flavobacterium urumqiense]SEF92960.1 SAM-dependent methyltransferase, MidA family [Flavobacterium urumqiense]
MLLSGIIIERIKKEGPLSFRDFMEMALYYPELGYYNSSQNKIGTDGDFYTSANLTAAFGAMIGRQIEEMWRNLEKKPFKIVEYGAGTGLLCHDILDYLKNNISLYNSLTYSIIEKSSSMREIQKKHLHEKVSWYNSIQEITEINGCILSNELIDNFSVHQVIMEDQLKEVFVDYKDGFIEILKPAKQELADYLATLNVQLPEGFRTEINLEAVSWIKDISKSLKKGYVITIDYGSLSAELYSNRRSCGTLLCYYKHQKNDNPYQFIGQQDITTHTNFSAISHWGSQYGMDCCGSVDQAQFLLALGIKEYQNSALNNNPNNLAQAMQESLINYRLLIDMGMKFKVLIQQKGVPEYPLSGLKFINSSKAVFG